MILIPKPPFPFRTLAAYLGRRATPGAESVDPTEYRRTVADGTLTARFQSETGAIVFDGPEREPTVEEVRRLGAVFHHDKSWVVPEALARDPVLGPLVVAVPGFRPVGAWEPFELCLRTIVGQQVSVAAARTLMGRLGARAPAWSPEAVARADLTGLGMPGKRTQTLRALAEAAAEGSIPWQAAWPELRGALARLPGFGPWTLDYLGIRLGRDLDAFPSADLGLMRGVGARSAKELLALAEPWRPYRGWAAAYLWMGPAS